MKKLSHLILITILLALSFVLKAQNEEKIIQTYPISISIMDESISVPNFWFLRYSYNPAVMVGTEYIWKQKEKHDWHFTGNLGFYHHKDWQSAAFISTELGYRYNTKRWHFYSRFGLGYAHLFSPKPEYSFNNGQFEEVKTKGSPALMVSLSANVSYKLADRVSSPEIYFTYGLSVDIPVSIYTGFHQLVGFGYKFHPFSNK